MFRLFIKLGFWSILAMLAMPSSRTHLLHEGFAPVSIAKALSLAATDVQNFCSEQTFVCETGQVIATDMADNAKESLMSAYHGLRKTADNVDSTIATGSINKQSKP